MAEHDEEHGEGHEESHGSHGGHGGGHASGGGHEEHEGAPEWLISFADNVALMMGFFVILLAMNMGPKAKGTSQDADGDGKPSQDMVDFVIAMRAAFNNPFDLKSTAPGDQVFIKRIKEKQGETSDTGVPGQTEKVQATRPTEYHSVTAAIPFENDSSLLTVSAREVIIKTCEKLKGQRFVIEVRGHASPSEVRRSQEKGLDLSYQRAKAVAKVMVEQGLKWEQLRPSAAGDSDRRLARTYDRDSDNINQRVEIIVTHEPVAGDPYNKEVGRLGNDNSDAPPAKSNTEHE